MDRMGDKQSVERNRGGVMSRFSSSQTLSKEEIHDVLRNRRRRNVLECLQGNMGNVTVKGLAEALAEMETGESPPPRNIRQSVYNSLHQTHLPKMDHLDLIEYDQDRKIVSMQPNIRQVDLYMEVVTPYNITWAEFYQFLMLFSLIIIVSSELGVPVLSTISPLIFASLFLALLGVSTIYRIWSRRWLYLQQLIS